ncbi:hypothetical protein H0H92_003771 [Tricholoma furcatifolium]|nr:hypothetical protein H0H92_003771 [Tricholoma furcatifolium]
MSTSTAPPPSSVLFARGVISRLAVWSTLRIAVQESWGGPGAAEKRTWLASVIVDTFEEQSQTPDDQYIEELLLQVMSDEYDVTIEDGSAESVAQDIVRMWDETRVGNADTVTKFEQVAQNLKGKKVEAEVHEDGEDSDEWEDEDGGDMNEDEDEVPQLIPAPQPQTRDEPEVDEDGFTLVKRGKGRR